VIRLMNAILLTAVLPAVACGGGGDAGGETANPADTADTADTANAGNPPDPGGVTDESDPARAEAYVEAITESGGGTRSDNECFARAFVDIVGVEALEAVVTPDELRQNPEIPITAIGIEISEDDANALYDEVSLCADLTKLVAGTVVADEGLDPDAVRCIAAELDEDLVRRFWVAVYSQDAANVSLTVDLQEDLTAAMAPCLGPGT